MKDVVVSEKPLNSSTKLACETYKLNISEVTVELNFWIECSKLNTKTLVYPTKFLIYLTKTYKI